MREHSAENDAPVGDAYGSNPAHHHIVGGEFVCSAPEDAQCRTFPTCECENWCCCGIPSESHDKDDHCCMTTTRSAQSCWIAVWVDAVGVEGSGDVQYDGEGEPIVPDGPVACDWGDGIRWTYVTPPGGSDA